LPISNSRNKKDDVLTNRTGGAYIPPARLRAMQEAITDKSSIAYQRISWEALKKSIHGIVNKVNVSNITLICRELFSENIIRGRGLLSRSILQAQGKVQYFTKNIMTFSDIIFYSRIFGKKFKKYFF
jgi:pre-mRNA-splicing factor CWC22